MLHDAFSGLPGEQNVLLAGYVALEDRETEASVTRQRNESGNAAGGACARLVALTHQLTDSIQVIQEVFD